jgi:hypothetical protein
LVYPNSRVHSRRINGFKLAQEPIPASPNRFDESGIFDGIAQRVSQFVHRNCDAMVEIDECIRRPQAFAKVFPGDDLPG